MSTFVVTGAGCSRASPAPPPSPRDASLADGALPTAGERLGRTEIVPRRPPPVSFPFQDGYPIAVVDPRPMQRVLRGDFDPPDTLVVAYEEDWAASLEQVISAAAGEARVLVLAGAPQARTPAFRHMTRAPYVDVFTGDFDSPWVRDYGPLQTYELATGPLWLDFSYASNRPEDDRVPSVLAARLQARLENPGFELDGGGVISNGQGLCALTRTSLLDAGFPEGESEALEAFLGSLGCHATAILPMVPTEPTGHADVVAQFLAADLVMVAWLDPDSNADLSRTLDTVAERLQTTAELGEYPLQIIRIPIETSGDTFFSYVNATRLRSRLLVPRFNELPETLERSAYSVLQLALPEVSLVPVDADVMVRLGGAVHCVTLGLGPTAAPAGEVQRAGATPSSLNRPSLSHRSG